MFDTIVSKLSNIVRTTVRAIGSVAARTPWFAPVAILVLFLIL